VLLQGIQLVEEPHDARCYRAARNAEFGEGDRQLEAPRASAARVDVDDTVALANERSMGMARDNHLDPCGLRVDVQLPEIVYHVYENRSELDQLSLRQGLSPGTLIVITADYGRGSYGG